MSKFRSSKIILQLIYSYKEEQFFFFFLPIHIPSKTKELYYIIFLTAITGRVKIGYYRIMQIEVF